MQKIMFSDACGLTQAVKKGHKTNTRRQEKALDREIRRYEEAYKVPFDFSNQYYDHGWECLVLRTSNGIIKVKPRYKVGEVVAVAQKYRDILAYLADSFRRPSPDYLTDKKGYTNKMFVKAELMPVRIRIKGIRAERLQDISDEDCIKEGIIEDAPRLQYSFPTNIGYCGQYPFDTPRAAFATLIEKVSKKGTWKSNPWVMVYEFQLEMP